ncbi:MAG: hypothetical protein N2749_03235 [Clostridia bacterium]|nr:hypothetical protein [Clostridia bacterium]
MNFFTINLRKSILNLKSAIYTIIFFLTLLIFLVFSKQSVQSLKNSIDIFLNCIIPSLLPFMILSEFALSTNVFTNVAKSFGKIFKKLFCIPEEASIAIILGFLCGFPSGSKAVNTLYEEGKITEKQAYTLLSFVNNCNPAFILVTVGIGIFNNMRIGIILLISHYLASIIFGIIFSRFNYYHHNTIIHENTENLNRIYKNSLNNRKKLNYVELLKKCILNSFFTLALIFGFLSVFNLIFDMINLVLSHYMLEQNTSYILSGIFEITRGSYNILNLDANLTVLICLESFILGFSGLCVIFQIFSTVSKHNFNFLKLALFKVMHGIISMIISYILIEHTSIFNVQTLTISSMINDVKNSDFLKTSLISAYINSILLIVLMLSIYMIIYNLKDRKRNKGKKSSLFS